MYPAIKGDLPAGRPDAHQQKAYPEHHDSRQALLPSDIRQAQLGNVGHGATFPYWEGTTSVDLTTFALYDTPFSVTARLAELEREMR